MGKNKDPKPKFLNSIVLENKKKQKIIDNFKTSASNDPTSGVHKNDNGVNK